MRRRTTVSLIAALFVSTSAFAQAPPGDQPAPPPPPDTAAPPPPPAAAAATEKPSAEGEQFPKMGKNHEIMVAKNVWFRFGVQIQAWVDYAQSSTKAGSDDGGYSLNFFARRARFFVGASFLDKVNAYVLFDAPRIGMAVAGGTAMAPTIAKFGTGAIVQDAWGEVKLAGDELMLEVGLMFIPFSRHDLGSSTTRVGLDTAFTGALMPNTSGSRDTGFELKSYLLDDHLGIRAGVFSGARQAPNGTNPLSHNAPRVAAYVQYEFLDTEKGYVYPGQNFGKKMILGVSAGVDLQKNDDIQTAMGTTETKLYSGVSATVFGSIPLAGETQKAGGDEIAFELYYQHFDGGGANGTAPTLFEQHNINAEALYYNKELELGIFGKFEMQKFADDANKALNTNWFGGGVKYYVKENLCNFTLAYIRAMFPDKPDTKNDTNEITLQVQFYYY